MAVMSVLAGFGGGGRQTCDYGAYGDCSVLELNYAPDPDGQTDYFNPYLFTASRLDVLDNGSLKSKDQLEWRKNGWLVPSFFETIMGSSAEWS
jgi:hypothetical protein